MPDPPKPQVPNYKYGVGQLTVFVDDFQSHVNGQAFRHNATMIDLSPSLVINGMTITDVQDAINALNNIVEPPSIAPATATTLGTVQLSVSGDLQGSATALRVTGLRGYAINNAPPSVNNVLTYNGSAWAPAASQGVFTPGGDLSGTASIQTVIGLTGDLISNPGFHTVRASTDYIQFISTASPKIVQFPTTSGAGANFNIAAQNSSSGSGGNLIIQGGTGSSLPGSTMININGLGTVIQAGQVVNNQNVIAFFTPAGLTSAQMPFNSGDRVMYVANANTVPTAAPSGGATLYATNGQLWVMQQDSSNFKIGSSPNPNIGGILSSTVGETIEYRSSAQAPIGSGVNLLASTPFIFPNNTAAYITCTFSAKEVAGSPSAAGYSIVMGFWCNGSGSITSIGSNTTLNARNVGAASWTAPVISSSSSNLIVTTGYSSSNVSNWCATIKIVITPQA